MLKDKKLVPFNGSFIPEETANAKKKTKSNTTFDIDNIPAYESAKERENPLQSIIEKFNEELNYTVEQAFDDMNVNND